MSAHTLKLTHSVRVAVLLFLEEHRPDFGHANVWALALMLTLCSDPEICLYVQAAYINADSNKRMQIGSDGEIYMTDRVWHV